MNEQLNLKHWIVHTTFDLFDVSLKEDYSNICQSYLCQSEIHIVSYLVKTGFRSSLLQPYKCCHKNAHDVKATPCGHLKKVTKFSPFTVIFITLLAGKNSVRFPFHTILYINPKGKHCIAHMTFSLVWANATKENYETFTMELINNRESTV